jgi:hypothetical protein
LDYKGVNVIFFYILQGRQGLKDYKYYGVIEDGFYKDLAVAGKYKNFDFSAL